MKKKRLFKLMSLIVMIVVFSFVTVKALTTGDTSSQGDVNAKIITDKATLTVNNVASNDKFSAYKILDAFYNATTNVVSYEFTTSFKTFLQSDDTFSSLTVEKFQKLTNGNLSNGSTTTGTKGDANSLDTLASKYASYIRTNSSSVTGVEMTVTKGATYDKSTATATVDAGSYLILPTSTYRVYAVMVGNAEVAANGTDAWQVKPATIEAKKTSLTLGKTVGDGEAKASYSIGDTVPYKLKVTVPVYPTNATNKKFTITDTFPEGINFNGVESIKFTALGQEFTNENGTIKSSGNTVATAQVQGKKITIDFSGIDYLTVTDLTIEYTGTIDASVKLGTNLVNKATLEYSNDPYCQEPVDGQCKTNKIDPDNPEVDPNKDPEDPDPKEPDPDNPEPDDPIAVVKVYGLNVYKVAKGGSDPLSNAEFELYEGACQMDSYGKKVDISGVSTFKTDGSGKAEIRGIKEGAYCLKEVKAPAGYSMAADKTVYVGPDQEGSGAVKDSAIQNDEADGWYKTTVEDNKTLLGLPFTGGIGTIIFTILGVVLIGVGYYVLVYRKKNQVRIQQ